MTRGNHMFYVEGLPYDKAEHVLMVARRFSERYGKPIKIECTFTDDELVTHHRVEYATVSKTNIQWGDLFK